MIKQFSATNYYSINGTTSIDFIVDDKSSTGIGYHKTQSDNVSLIEAIIGPNASGKTTSLRALAFLQWIIVSAYRADRINLPFKPHIAIEEKNKPTQFDVTFEMEQTTYRYTLTVTQERILSEILYIRTPSKVRTTYKKLFSREWKSDETRYNTVDNGFNLPNYEGIQADDLKNTSIIGAARRFGHSYSKKIFDYWHNLRTNIDIDDRWMPYQYGAYQALMFYTKHAEPKAQAERTIHSYDLGIDSFGTDGFINHNFGGKTYKLQWTEESSGTQQLLVLQKMIDEVLHSGSIAVIDEFDAYLHTTMVKVLLARFLSPVSNPNNAQLLLSTHDVEILNDLKKYQINFAGKKDGETVIKRLDSFKGVRIDDNYRKKYLAGEYAALAHINLTDTKNIKRKK